MLRTQGGPFDQRFDFNLFNEKLIEEGTFKMYQTRLSTVILISCKIDTSSSVVIFLIWSHASFQANSETAHNQRVQSNRFHFRRESLQSAHDKLL
jgi:hypothetical protein